MNCGRILAFVCLAFLLAFDATASDHPDRGMLSRGTSARPDAPPTTDSTEGGGALAWTELVATGDGRIYSWGSDLVMSLSNGRGLWLLSVGQWTKLTPKNPYILLVHCDRVFAGFLGGDGLWVYDRVLGWSQMTTWAPDDLIPHAGSVIADFGFYGIWRYECPEPDFTVSFLSSQSSPGPDTVAMAQGPIQDNRITVDINVTQTSNIFGAAFDVVFDPASASFDSWSAGDLLEQGGASVFYAIAETGPGRLVIGATRQSPATTTNATGTVALIHLTFRATEAGVSPILFANEGLLDDVGGSLGPLNWFGGTLAAH
jgi:hypothetical protein